MAAVTTVYDIKVNYLTNKGGASRTLGSALKIGASFAGVAAAAVGAAAAVSKLTRGVSDLIAESFKANQGFQDAEVTMAGLAQLNLGGTFKENMKDASILVKQFEKDAIKSTATTKDLVDFAALVQGPIMRAGGSMRDLRGITKGAVVAARAFGIAGEVAARDIEGALTGNLKSVDRFARALLEPLGFTVEKWNKLVRSGPEKALKKLKEILKQDAIKEMAEAQAKTWSGVTSTLDDIKVKLVKTFGGPLFENVTNFLRRLNEELLDNIVGLEAVADVIGRDFSTVFNTIAAGFGGAEGAALKLVKIMDLIRFNTIGFAVEIQNAWINTVNVAKTVANVIGEALMGVQNLIRRAEAFVSGVSFTPNQFQPFKLEKQELIDPFALEKAFQKAMAERSKKEEQPSDRKRKKPPKNQVNVNISRIEIASDDPDRFAFNLVESFKNTVNSPTQAAAALNEG